MKKVVIVGGGTGTFVVTQALKIQQDIELTKIVTVFDSGGSTARLKDEFGFLPVGDLRQSLAALAAENHHSWIRELLLYRFSKGEGLEGHNLGNLILTALQDMTGSTPKALEIATKIFRLKGNILPVSLGNAEIKITYQNGEIEVGEHKLDDMKRGGRRITKIELTQPCNLYSKSKKALEEADYIIIGPGDMYASVLPNFIVKGVKNTLKKSSAQIIYVCNLMTRYTQTHQLTASDHINLIQKHIGRDLNYVLVNNGKIQPKIAQKYASQKEFPVVDDLGKNQSYKVIRSNFASSIPVKKKKGDKVPRALMRHDKDRLVKALLKVIK